MTIERGEITVVAAPMFAGKTSRVIWDAERMARAKKRVATFKHPLDDRYSGSSYLNTHDNRHIPCIAEADLVKIYENVIATDAEVVIIDEIQFYMGKDELLLAMIEQMASEGRTIVLAGLELDFRGETFGPMGKLLAYADNVEKLYAVCSSCGSLHANRTQRLVNGQPAKYDDPIIMVGADEAYEPRCTQCHSVPGKPKLVDLIGLS